MAQETEPLTVDDLKRKELRDVFEVTLTPEQCRRILDASIDVNFRALADNSATTRQLTETMKRGHWQWTDADPLRLHLNDAGAVVCTDGQHRLWAATQARKNLRAVVLWGKEFAAGIHVDRNKPRNIAQYLNYEHGLKSAPVYVALMRFHLSRVVGAQNNLSADYVRVLVDDEDIINNIVDNIDGLKWVVARHGNGGTRGFNVTAYGVLLWELFQINPATADEFNLAMVATDLEGTDPLAQLRRVVGRRYQETNLRAHREYTMSNLVKAHNMRQTGQQVTKWVTAVGDDIVFPAGFKLPEMAKIANGRRS
jgi:hypothetical protein